MLVSEFCAMSPKGVFVREATGLQREWSAKDCLYWNFLTVGIMSLVLLTFLPINYPGGDPLLSIVLLTFASIPFFVAYVMLQAAMPRSGGDYVYQSRLLHPALGFSLVQMGFGLFPLGLGIGAAFGGWTTIEMGIAPMFIRLGMLWNITDFTNFGIWATTSTGLTVLTLVLFVFTALALLVGMGTYAKIQWMQMIFVAITIVAMYIFLGTLDRNTFVTNLNAVMQQLGSGPNFYSNTISTARASGFDPTPAFNWPNTIGIWGAMWLAMAWYSYQVFMGGEIKSASSLKKQMFASVGSLFIMNIGVYVVLFWLFLRASGTEFFNSLAFTAFTGALTHYLPGVPPNMVSLMIMVMNNPFLVILISLGLIMYGWQITINSLLPPTRTVMAAAFDRILPDSLADVNDRFHVPLKSITLLLAIAVLSTFLLNFTTWAGAFSYMPVAVIAWIATMIAAVIFPFRKSTKAIYEASPIAKYKIGAIPLISILGVCGAVLQAMMIYYLATAPSLLPNLLTWEAMLLGYVFFFAVYYVARWYRARQGIDIGLAFKVIPPE